MNKVEVQDQAVSYSHAGWALHKDTPSRSQVGLKSAHFHLISSHVPGMWLNYSIEKGAFFQICPKEPHELVVTLPV